MAFLGKLFGGGKTAERQEQKVTTSVAIQKLRDTEEMLKKRQEHIDNLIKEQETIIRANGTKNKKVALAALKKKKRLEKQAETVENTLTTLDLQRESLENAHTNTEIVKNMSLAAKALKTVHSSMDVDKVEDLMEDVREQQQLSEEILNVITDRSMFGPAVDEDELLKELETMEQEELDKQLLDAGSLPEVPEAALVASGSKSKEKEPEEDELEALKQWAA
ncbi:charged multivesicular body protein 4b [Tetranychus urticae]|nr:charged multivesicular body protein 4b [Tetranychus urticae]